uniref:Fatty acid hydroxylase domain-containing protein n=1 Tax=Tetradesmus obliquus TaxID=3088 RepID=A0A383VA56_TETOB|eukprot:jgi/Sobl393_1/11053/SZX62071.1
MEAVATAARGLVHHCQTVAAQRLTLHSPELWVSLLPVVFYWAVSAYFEVLDRLKLPAFEKHRLHSEQEAQARNQVSRSHVFWRVLLQHAIQVAVGVLMTLADPGFCDAKPWTGWLAAVPEFFVAMLVMDAWQYIIHRAMHESKALYNAIHSHHHRMIICYAYGALYNHPLEALLLDTVGGVVSFYASGISCKGSIAFFTFSTVKTVLDHSGYRFPVNPLHGLFPNNAAYHDVHHDPRGFRKNYSQPYFTHWDWLLGTYMAPGELKPLAIKQQQKQQQLQQSGQQDGDGKKEL